VGRRRSFLAADAAPSSSTPADPATQHAARRDAPLKPRPSLHVTPWAQTRAPPS
jgi:hypothetical protein